MRPKPCPFCGATNGEVFAVDESGDTFAWWCGFCKTTGPIILCTDWEEEDCDMGVPEMATDMAIAKWNTRM